MDARRGASYGRAIAYSTVTGGVPLLLVLLVFAIADAVVDASGDNGGWLGFGLRVWTGTGLILGAGLFLVVMVAVLTRRNWTRIELGSLSSIVSAMSVLVGNLVAHGSEGLGGVLVLVGFLLLFAVAPLTFVLGALTPRLFGVPAPRGDDPRISDWVNAKVGR